MSHIHVLEQVLEGLMRRYRERVPDVTRIVSAMVGKGLVASLADIENDHIAFRTMGVPYLGIRSLEKIFLALGYKKEDYYRFDKKKLDAYWYSPPEPRFPRVFISELCVSEVSVDTQAIIRAYTDTVTEDPVDILFRDFGGMPSTAADAAAIDAFLHQPLWRTPTWADYQTLAKESEYASWVIYNRYYLNHFTITIHNLPEGYNTVALFNGFLESLGVTLNDAGGKIKISPDKKLIQSATVAQLIDAPFDNGAGGEEIHTISGSYVEFAQREILDDYAHLPLSEIKRHHRKEGFERDNADGIFESTYLHQTAKTRLLPTEPGNV